MNTLEPPVTSALAIKELAPVKRERRLAQLLVELDAHDALVAESARAHAHTLGRGKVAPRIRSVSDVTSRSVPDGISR